MRANLKILALLGALAVARIMAAEEPWSEQPIRLPPFLVEEGREGKGDGPAWLYAQVPGFEVLSACDKDLTQAFVRQVLEQRVELRSIVPEPFLFPTSLPTTLILFPDTRRGTIDAQMLRVLAKTRYAPSHGGRFSPMDDIRLTDPDSSYLFIFLDDWAWQTYARKRNLGQLKDGSVVLSPEYVRFLMESRAPALPEWYLVGASRFYASLAVQYSPAFEQAGLAAGVPGVTTSFEFEPDTWLSEKQAGVLREHPQSPRPLVPLGELLVARSPAAKPARYQEVWEAEAEAFVRWALSGRLRNGSDCLRRFAEESSRRPASEEMFTACFGMNYADAFDALNDYLPTAVKETLPLASARPDQIPALVVREASPMEIHRIQGEWSRRVLHVIKRTYPGAYPEFADQTRAILQGSFDQGDRDPRLLASLAFFWVDDGDARSARALLEAFPESLQARPLASVALAQLELVDALRHPGGPGGRLSESQAARVLGLLLQAEKLDPPLEGAYLTAVRTEQHLGREPTPGERDYLNRGALLFPRSSGLVVQAAAWDLRSGDLPHARALVDLGLWETGDADTRGRLEILRKLVLEASAVARKP